MVLGSLREILEKPPKQFFGNRAEKKSEASNQKSTLVCTWGSVWGLEQNFWIKKIF